MDVLNTAKEAGHCGDSKNDMNLFLCALNIDEETISRSMVELSNMSKVYPNLDRNTLWSQGDGSPVFAASIQNSKDIIKPRDYIFKDGNDLTFFDGCLIDINNEFVANNASHLSKNWESLKSSLEGQFVTIKIRTSPPRIELINDCLGVYQVFYTRINDAWLISNSVQLISNVMNSKALDPVGVSYFLGFGWAANNRTLRRNVKVIPGGQHWTWHDECKSPEKQTYFKRSSLAGLQKAESPKKVVKNLALDLAKTVEILSNNYSTFEAPITAGRDSRVIVSLLLNKKINSSYFTAGDSQSTEVRVASEIANKYNLEHRLDGDSITDALVIDNWKEACERVIDINDGMVTLAHVKVAALPQPIVAELPIHFYGGGGEIGRGFYENDRYSISRHSELYVRQYLSGRLIRNNNLFSQDVIQQCDNYLTQFIDDALDDGFEPVDLPAVFYAYERTRRWAGANFRQVNSYKDVFSPFCTRAYVEAAFSISSLHRYSDSLHYNLMKVLVPDILSIQFDKPWRSQAPLLNITKFTSAAIARKIAKILPSPPISKNHLGPSTQGVRHERSIWLEAKLNDIRETCLDSSSSILWDNIDRTEFERLTSDYTGADERLKVLPILYDIYTLFYYEERSCC